MMTLHAETPKLFKSSQYNSKVIAEAANYFIKLGEDKGIQELMKLSPPSWTPPSVQETKDGLRLDRDRVAWLLRILYKPKKEPIRQPLFGALGLPYMSMKNGKWPIYPLVESEGVYFVLADGYFLAGRAERIEDYVAYCKKNGIYRKKLIKKPTAKEATKALNFLFSDKRWKEIEWSYSQPNHSYTLSEESRKKFIKKQTKY